MSQSTRKMNREPFTPDEAQFYGRQGGLVRSDKKRYASLMCKSQNALCKNCKAQCILKKGNLLESKNHKCIVPEARAKSIWFKMPVMSEEILDKLDAETLFRLIQSCNGAKDYKMMHDAIINKKRTDYPKIKEMKLETSNLHINYKDLKQIYDEVQLEKSK